MKEHHEGDTYMGSGDVKYHLGTSYDRPTISGEWFGVHGGCSTAVQDRWGWVADT